MLAGGLLDATVNAGACTGGCYNYIGNGAGSMATLNVTGAGSEVRTLRLFTVGASAVFTNPPTDFTLGEAGGETKAFVNVLAGGKLSSGRATVGNAMARRTGMVSRGPTARWSWMVSARNGSWPATPSTTSLRDTMIGQSAGGTGTVTVSGGGKLSIDNANSPVGLNQDRGINVGVNGKGTLVIAGTGSTLENTSSAGFINVGQNSTGAADGTFQVLAGASATSMFLNVGLNAGTKGAMLIDGVNAGVKSTLILSGVNTGAGSPGTAAAFIGRNGGEGTATVSNGGYWLITDGGQDSRSINASPQLSIGRDANSKGLLTITGPGSKVEVVSTSMNPGAGVGDNYNPFVNIGRDNAVGTGSAELMVSAGGKFVHRQRRINDNRWTHHIPEHRWALRLRGQGHGHRHRRRLGNHRPGQRRADQRRP